MNKAFGLIGIAQKAAKVKAGEYLSMKALKEGKASLFIIASDTSEKAKARLQSACRAFDCPTVIYGNKEELGHAIGAKGKSVICLTDQGFSKVLLNILEQTKQS